MCNGVGAPQTGARRSQDGARPVKKFCGLLRETVAVKYGAIDALRQSWPVPPMCQLLGVSIAGYYAWKKRGPSSRAMREPGLQAEIAAVHCRTRATFEPERLQKELIKANVEIGVHSIKRIRRKLGLRCKQNKKFKATTNSRHNLPVAPNLLSKTSR
jgi:putative transposase